MDELIEKLGAGFEFLDQTFREINEAWRYGALSEVEKGKMKSLENRVGEAVLNGDISTLKVVLGDYKQFMLAAVQKFKNRISKYEPEA